MKLKKKYTLKELSKLYNCEVIGDETSEIDSVCSLTNSKKKSLSYLSDVKFISLLNNTKINFLITTKAISQLIKSPNLMLLISDNPLLVFSSIIRESIDLSKSNLFTENNDMNNISENSLIGKNLFLLILVVFKFGV